MSRLLRRSGPFRRFWAGQTVNGVGSAVSSIALPLLALDQLHATTLEVALLEAVEWLPALLIGLPVGVLVDRHAPRALMLGANFGQAAAMASVPAAAALGSLNLALLFGAATGAGLFGVFFQTAYSPYVRYLVPAPDLVEANARLQAGASVASVSGPGLGGALVQAVGAASAVTVDAFSFLVSAFFLWWSGPVVRDDSPPAPSGRSSLLEGARYLVADRVLVTLTLAGAGANLFLSACGAIEVVFLVRVVRVPAGTVGALFTVGAAGGLAGALLSSRVIGLAGVGRTARLALGCTAPFCLLLPLAHHGAGLALFAIGGFGVSFGIVVASVAMVSLRQALCPANVLGRVSAASRLASATSVPTGALLGGLVGQAIGTRAALAFLAMGYVVVGWAIFFSPLKSISATELKTTNT